jgi:CheY-like chemotaxis protein
LKNYARRATGGLGRLFGFCQQCGWSRPRTSAHSNGHAPQGILTANGSKLLISRRLPCALIILPRFSAMFNQSPQILLIEGEPILLEITEFRLELLGYQVVSRDSAEHALEWLADNLPNTIIVDHVLPGMDGIEFINRLSNDTRTANVPIMFLSTNGDLDDVQKAYNAGADEYLVIPYDPLVLEAKVERLTSALAPVSA